MNPFASSGPPLLLLDSIVTASLDEAFSLPPPRGLSYRPQHPLRSGRYASEAFPCGRFPQRYGPPLSGDCTRLGCRHPNVPTTASWCASTSISAKNTVTRQRRLPAAIHSWLRMVCRPSGNEPAAQGVIDLVGAKLLLELAEPRLAINNEEFDPG